MCLAVVALGAHPHYRLVIAANRDEYHARAADPATWWTADGTRMLAGRDRTAGGTWLGITPDARWALVTNFREPGGNDAARPSRGALVGRILRGGQSLDEALVGVLADGARYNGFNLLCGDVNQGRWASNRAPRAVALAPGLHALSNAGLDPPWPKYKVWDEGKPYVTAFVRREPLRGVEVNVMKTDQSTFWVYKGVVLQSDLRSRDIVIRSTLQDLQEDAPVDPSSFEVPARYKRLDLDS